ncbi:hypothetical protein K3F48_20330 [Methylosinus sp. Sm6]|nr:hypothetical protein [Methylosinus sp. Sm6]MBY6243502.1 hypothetical protein [Methylosinus sp. Sm6]
MKPRLDQEKQGGEREDQELAQPIGCRSGFSGSRGRGSVVAGSHDSVSASRIVDAHLLWKEQNTHF